MNKYCMKLIKFIDSALHELKTASDTLKINFGYQLLKAQLGELPLTTESISEFGNDNLIEFRDSFAGEIQDAVYALTTDSTIYILHYFSKKMIDSFLDLKPTIDLINDRIKVIGNNEVKSSGNIFADIDLPNAEEIFLKAQLSYKIDQEIKKRSLTQAKAAKLLEIPQPRISQIINGKFQDISEFKLMRCLNKLGYNVNIEVSFSNNELGTISMLYDER
ncbi:MAG: helix-turn-helix domain-containing protein [Neisseriales bacterium]|nr:MAG: helix-turn-helix domain-containing protein [Neisseriales bacterium]